jgi:hypothetical protein
VRNHRVRSIAVLAFLLLLLPLSARAELTRDSAPLIIASTEFCSSETELEVVATPKGAFEVIWTDDAQDFAVKGLRFGRNLHGGLFFSELSGTFAGRYQLAINAVDTGDRPDDPLTSYRLQLDLEGNPVATARFKPPRFIKIAPAAKGDSLQFRFEPPFFGSNTCASRGLLASRINSGGAPVSAESRVNRRASAWGGPYLAVDRLPDDTFIAAYSTCEKFTGVVARRLNASGAPVGGPFNLTLPARVGNFGGVNLLVAAHDGNDFAVAAMISDTRTGISGPYMQAVVNGEVAGPTALIAPIGNVVDLEASPTGGYLLLFRGPGPAIFAQELDARGVPQGTPLALTGEAESGVAGAAASLPDGRLIVVTRAQESDETSCSERVILHVLKDN